MATKIKGLDMLEKHGLSVVRKFNICGWFEYHVLNEAGQISRHTVQQRAIDMALNTLQAISETQAFVPVSAGCRDPVLMSSENINDQH